MSVFGDIDSYKQPEHDSYRHTIHTSNKTFTMTAYIGKTGHAGNRSNFSNARLDNEKFPHHIHLSNFRFQVRNENYRSAEMSASNNHRHSYLHAHLTEIHLPN